MVQNPNVNLPRLNAGDCALPTFAEFNLLPDRHYNPAHCLAIYHQIDFEDAGSLEIAALLLAEGMYNRSGASCYPLQELPEKNPELDFEIPPEGSVVVGVYSEMLQRYPDLLANQPAPEPDGYILIIDRCILICGANRRSCMYGVQSLLQTVAITKGTYIDSLIVRDYPVHQERGFFYDVTIPKVESLMRIAGVLCTFKGCRLHLMIHPGQQGFDRADEIELQELAESYLEYNINLTPWLDQSTQPNSELLLQLISLFYASSVGIGFSLGERTVSELLDWILPVAENEDIKTIYVGFDLALALENAPQILRDKITVMVVDSAAAKNQLDYCQAKNLAACFYIPTGSHGFAAEIEQESQQRLQSAFDLGNSYNLTEIGCYAAPVHGGYLWSIDLCQVVTILCWGWGHLPPIEQVFQRYKRLLFGDAAKLVSEIHTLMHDCIPDCFRLAENTELRDIALGATISPQQREMLEQLDWDTFEEKIMAFFQYFRRCRRLITRNVDALDRLLLAPTALQFLQARILYLPLAHQHVEVWRRKERGLLEQALSYTDQVANVANSLLQLLIIIDKNHNLCHAERLRLESFIQKLDDFRRAASSCISGVVVPLPKLPD